MNIGQTFTMRAAAGLATLVLGLAGAHAAWAVPARTIVVGTSQTSVVFDGGPVTDFKAVSGTAAQHGVQTPGRDETLIKVEVPGRLEITTTSDGPPASEIDLELFVSDAEGTRGAELSQSTNDGPVEQVAARVQAGYYLLSASGWPSVAATYKGEVKLTVPEVPAASPAPPVAAPKAPPPAVKKKKKLTCAQKARRLKGAKKRRAALRRCAKARRG